MDELIERVSRALEAGYPGAPNGRVRDVPDRRAIRWYTSIGLVDRPLGMRGRTALYGARHLRQLVAVKRLQAQGLTLADIQSDLSLATDETLATIARIPGHLLPPTADGDSDSALSSRPQTRFWARRPATTEPASPGPLPAAPPAAPSGDEPASSRPLPAAPAAAPSRDEANHATPPEPDRRPQATPHQPGPDQPGITSPDGSVPAPGGPGPNGADRAVPAEPGHDGHDGPDDAGQSAAELDRAATATPSRRGPGGAPSPGAGGVGRRETGAVRGVRETRGGVYGVDLGAGVLLILPGPVAEDDLGDLAGAAEPLLRLLAARGLIDGSQW